MTNNKNLPAALFHSVRAKFFTHVVIDYGRSEPIRMKGWTLLVLALFLSRKIKTYECKRIGLAFHPVLPEFWETLLFSLQVKFRLI
jgi:hypothetical protein